MSSRTSNTGQTNGGSQRRSPLARLVPVLGLAVGALAAAAVIRAPNWLIEQLIIETRLSDYIPAAQPPLGMNARIALALCMGIASTACTWLVLKWLFVPKPRPQWPVGAHAKPMARALHIEEGPPEILKEKQQIGTSGLMGLLRRRTPAGAQDMGIDLPEDTPLRRRRPILTASELGPPLDDFDPHAIHEWHSAEYAPPADVPVLDLGPMMMSTDVEPVYQAVEIPIIIRPETVAEVTDKMPDSQFEPKFAPHFEPLPAPLPAPQETPAILGMIVQEEARAASLPRPVALHVENIPCDTLDAATMPLNILIAGLELRLKGGGLAKGLNIPPPVAVDASAAQGWRQGKPVEQGGHVDQNRQVEQGWPIDHYDAPLSSRFAVAR